MKFRPHLTLALLMGFAMTAAAPGTATASKPSYGCAPGFNLGERTYAEYLLLPGTKAALDQGLVSEETILGGLAHFDHNSNGVVCVKSVPGWQISHKPFAIYLYNVVDDAASAP